jgi:hypothetical protein
MDNIKALSHDLTPEQMKALEDIYPLNIGFPMSHFGTDPHIDGESKNALVKAAAQVQYVKAHQAIRPGQGV